MTPESFFKALSTLLYFNIISQYLTKNNTSFPIDLILHERTVLSATLSTMDKLSNYSKLHFILFYRCLWITSTAPVTSIIVPVIISESSSHKNEIVLAISSPVPGLPIGVLRSFN